MGLFKTTVDDIKKFQEQGKIKKLLNLLDNKDEEVVIESIKAINSFNDKEILKEMIKILASEKYSFTDVTKKRERNTNVSNAFRTIIEENRIKYSPILVEQLLADILLMKKQYDPYNDHLSLHIWHRIENYKELILKIGEQVSISLAPLLDHDDMDVRLHSAGLLNILKDESRKEKWKNILEKEHMSVWKCNKFQSSRLDRYLVSKNTFEIPIFCFSCDSFDGTAYSVGLTDKFLYIHVDLDLLAISPTGKGKVYDFPLSMVDKIIANDERQFSICIGRQEQSNEYNQVLTYKMTDAAVAVSSIYTGLPSYKGESNAKQAQLIIDTFVNSFNKIKNNKLSINEITNMSLCKQERIYGKC